MRVTVGMIVGMLAEGHATTDVLQLYPYLEAEDIVQALSCAALRTDDSAYPPIHSSCSVFSFAAMARSSGSPVTKGASCSSAVAAAKPSA